MLMGFSDLGKLKQLSWYTTVPLLVFAVFLQDEAYLDPDILTIYGGISIVGHYFLPTVGLLFLTYWAWLSLISRMDEGTDIFFTLALATFILSLAGVGVGMSLLKPSDIALSYNIFWFLGLGSIAFNLYQMVDDRVKARDQDRKESSSELESSR
ncbi:hypothetical protein AB4226_09195 [Vibrio artabrorum]|uniref:hypothetical protein n=1 Tax=Vibrio artabrorum TaxID=446374 RepID=UPI0035508F88